MVHNVHHMLQITKLREFNTAPYFTVDTMRTLFDLKEQSFYSNLKRWLKKGDLVRLKKGVYTTNVYIKNIDSANVGLYSEFIANALMPESYLSTEYILQKYGMLAESVFAYTSVTAKRSREFNNKLGKFLYTSLSRKLFYGFTIEQVGGFNVAKATKMKALFDFLYLGKWTNTENSRINWDVFNDTDRNEFAKIVNSSDSPKMKKILEVLKW